ncbi:kremen protein 1 [Dunckerocampus dactyliophorus]|uniref:kremen protein 1 n=1 Tax=Dunckerocampus dactyliophorus TaxID=161453 RepID=UPI002406763A|nr:kremen protein 1 [Dunckerocampus dactyliophorus]XP_054628969.1 kremen protein 1 [Dunckerocampus dactyliophorus]
MACWKSDPYALLSSPGLGGVALSEAACETRSVDADFPEQKREELLHFLTQPLTWAPFPARTMDPWTTGASALLVAAFALSSAALSHFDTECYTANGEDYRGFQNQTSLQGGKPCLFWNETFQHPYNTLKYPNGEGGLGSHNYCRNPDGDVQPWCYIADHEDGIYWRYCDIPTCQMPGNLGCFRDSGDPPALSGATETSNKLTIQNCISFCRKQRYKLAGMESGYACFCGNEVDLQDHNESPSMECNHVCFGDHTQPCGGDGWVIVFDTRVGSCGGNYTSPSGVIYSPDFPDKYGASRVCYWTVQVPGSSAILFNFTFFDISDQTDMVELLNGYTNQVVARFDWRSPPRELVNITGDFVIVYFYSDRTNQAQGFALLYQALRTHKAHDNDNDGGGETTGDEDEGFSSTVEPPRSPPAVTDRSNLTSKGRSSQILYVITSSPGKQDHNMPGQWAGPGETTGHSAMWTIYALAALLILTVVAMVAKLLLHITVKSPGVPTVSGSDGCGQNPASSEPWIILYRPSTISLFKKKLKNHHGDLSPLVGN